MAGLCEGGNEPFLKYEASTESYPAFARIGLRENPGKNLNQVTCPDRDSNPGHLVSQPDALTVTPQVCTHTSRLRRLPTDPELRSCESSIPVWADYLVGFFPRFFPTIGRMSAREGPRPSSRLLASRPHAEAEVDDHPTRMAVSCGYPTAKSHMVSGRMIWVAILLYHDDQSIHGIAGSRSPSLLHQNEVVRHPVAISTANRKTRAVFNVANEKDRLRHESESRDYHDAVMAILTNQLTATIAHDVGPAKLEIVVRITGPLRCRSTHKFLPSLWSSVPEGDILQLPSISGGRLLYPQAMPW
ncbi:hypothetical protein ANN_16921 [Periplaneta americana]|uniref:Uncharacterized protein n=1 Tax=Periplaneta americana TaxID=6978 RepID=A0ABQ8SSK0_PERAM|nr:hypothetical protein ANN_16921 [Periplaneta americana]